MVRKNGDHDTDGQPDESFPVSCCKEELVIPFSPQSEQCSPQPAPRSSFLPPSPRRARRAPREGPVPRIWESACAPPSSPGASPSAPPRCVRWRGKWGDFVHARQCRSVDVRSRLPCHVGAEEEVFSVARVKIYWLSFRMDRSGGRGLSMGS